MRRRITRRRLATTAVTVAICMLAGCAAKTDSWGDREAGLVLEHRFEEDKPHRYRVTSAFNQQMDITGESIVTTSDQSTDATVVSKGLRDGKYALEVTIDAMTVDIGTPQGDMSPDLAGLIGQSFEMSLSVLGEESDLPDPETMQYDLGPGGKRNAISGFQMMFPNLTNEPIKVGDTWTTTDSLSEESSGGSVHLSFESVNTLAGFEVIDGRECAKIAATFSGTIEGDGMSGPAEWTSEGVTEGTSTWYFAFEEGIFVRETTEGTGMGTVFAEGPQGSMAIPTSQDFTMEVRLIE